MNFKIDIIKHEFPNRYLVNEYKNSSFGEIINILGH